MVESDKNPTSETQIKAQKEEKKIIVHSPRGKLPTYVTLHAPMNVLHLLSPLSVLIGGKQKVVLMSQYENRIHPCSTYHTLNDWTLNGRPGKDRCEHNTTNRLLKIGIFLSKNGLNF